MKAGYFVELGAADGKLISNTLALEESFKWKGLCIEPSSAYLDLLKSGRRCVKRSDVVSGKTAEHVSFLDQARSKSTLASPSPPPPPTPLLESTTQTTTSTKARAPDSKEGLYSGIINYMDAYSVQGVVVTKATRTLSEVLDESNAPMHIDFLSLDTEGSEYDILKTFPYHKRTFGIILVEHNHILEKRKKIRVLLESKGYVRIRCIETDDLYASLRVISHYKIRADPRECHSILLPFVCSSKLNSNKGKQECRQNGGEFLNFLDVPLSPKKSSVEWYNKFWIFMKENKGSICSQLLSECENKISESGKDLFDNEPIVFPIASAFNSPSLEIKLDVTGAEKYRFDNSLWRGKTIAEQLNLPNLCLMNSIGSDDCIELSRYAGKKRISLPLSFNYIF